MKIPYVDFRRQFRQEKQETLDALTRVFERGDFIMGEDVTLFEREFAALCGTQHAVSVANGTDSLILSLKALGVGPGDEVITAANSWISSASAIALVGATPVFADVGEDQNILPDTIERSLTPRTKCILPVHLTGRCADMEGILSVAKKAGLPVLEDAAQAVGARRGPHVAGGAGTLGSFSLHPLKNLNAAGDAGIVTTNSAELAQRLRLLRNHGLKDREHVTEWGYNSRLDTLQASLLRTRLRTLDQTIVQRQQNAARYMSQLDGWVLCPQVRKEERHTFHVFVIQCKKRDELQAHLEKQGVETKVHYPIPIHFQEAAAYLNYGPGSLPTTERQAKRILSLPIHNHLTNEEIDYVCSAIKAFYGAKGKGLEA